MSYSFNVKLIITSLLAFLLACNNEATTTDEQTSTTTDEVQVVLDEFDRFYEKFHADSSFQKAHILFPLQGIPSNADSASLRNNNFRWQQEEWVIQHKLAPDSEFKSTILPIDSALVIERIMHQSGDYAMERRFAKLNDEWMLIYYAGVNRVLK
ncbi:MAG: hypothetical protein AAF847_11215 [Bacteroidota bacterium]